MSVTALKAETPTWATPPTPCRPAGDFARVLSQRVERVAPAVDEVAEIAAPDLVHDLWQVVGEPAHCAADRLHHRKHDGADDDHDPEHEHRGAQRPAPAESSLHRIHHRQENGDAEDRDEDHEQDVGDRDQRRRDGDRGSDQQNRPDRYRGLDLGPPGVAGHRGGLCRGHLLFIPTGADDLQVAHRAHALDRDREDDSVDGGERFVALRLRELVGAGDALHDRGGLIAVRRDLAWMSREEIAPSG